MNQALDEFQQRLLITLVEAARRGSNVQAAFTWYEQPPGSVPVLRDHAGLRENVSVARGDLKALADAGLATEQIHIAGLGHITLTQLAFDVYDRWAQQPAPRARPIGF